MSVAWKIGRAIKPLSGHLSGMFSPGDAGSHRPPTGRGVGRRQRLETRGTLIYIEGFRWSRHDGCGAASPAGTTGGPEMAEARPGHRPEVRFEGVGPPGGRLGGQAGPLHVRRVAPPSVHESDVRVPLRHRLDYVRQRVGRSHDQGSGGTSTDSADRSLRDLPIWRRVYDLPFAQSAVRVRRV